MSSIDALINQRMSTPQNTTKVKELAKRSREGNLTSFSGLFKVHELSHQEQNSIRSLLETYCLDEKNIQTDLPRLLSITSEVKAITNQAALLHGERIKQAQDIFSRYKEGAFSAWLAASYGNRQTPYNFMLYYTFSMALPEELRSKVDTIPRQVIYTLASREASMEEKREIVEAYAGETKQEMLDRIRARFPLGSNDRRKPEHGQSIYMQLTKLYYAYKQAKEALDDEKKKEIFQLLQRFISLAK